MSFPPAGPSRILLPAALCSTGVTPLPRSYGGSDSLTALLTVRVSPFHVLDLPTIPPPTTPDALASLSHATPQLARPPGPSRPGLGFAFCRQARRVSGRIAFVILRTARSSFVAPHPALRRRNYGRLQAGERLPEVDFHHSDRAHLRAHRQQAPACGSPSGSKSRVGGSSTRSAVMKTPDVSQLLASAVQTAFSPPLAREKSDRGGELHLWDDPVGHTAARDVIFEAGDGEDDSRGGGRSSAAAQHACDVVKREGAPAARVLEGNGADQQDAHSNPRRATVKKNVGIGNTYPQG